MIPFIMPLKIIRQILKNSIQLAVIDRRLDEMADRIDDLNIRLEQYMSIVSLRDRLPPIPPKHFQMRVAGAFNPTFFTHGKNMFHDLEAVLHQHGLDFAHFERILDFGCGCGRFLVPMSFILPPEKLCGTDIDPDTVGWLRYNYPIFQDLDVNPVMPPTKYPDATFDFIFAVSIFTHLPEAMEQAWLSELARILKPGGHAIFTTIGKSFLEQLKPEACEEFIRKGFYYFVSGDKSGLPDFYQCSYHTEDYIRQNWSRYFDIVAFKPRRLDHSQDAVLVRKRS